MMLNECRCEIVSMSEHGATGRLGVPFLFWLPIMVIGGMFKIAMDDWQNSMLQQSCGEPVSPVPERDS